MSKRQSYVICGETFDTKSALQERIKKILYRYKENEALLPDDFSFMFDVLKNHPDFKQKMGSGIACMRVRQNPVYTNTRGFWIERTDGSGTDFSYLECLKATPHAKRFINACRAAIEPDIQLFKAEFFNSHRFETPRCPYTGEPLKFVGSHVDHKAPRTFQWLTEAFINLHSIPVDDIKINGKAVDNTYQDTFDDQGLERLWVEFHKRNAELQVVSAKANLSILRKGQS